MSDEKLPELVTLDWVGIRLLTAGAELRDFQKRFTAMDTRRARSPLWRTRGAVRDPAGAVEAPFGALETRYAIQEGRLTAMLDLLVCVAARIGVADRSAN